MLYISEVKYLGRPSLDFIEITVTEGTGASNIQVVIFNANGTIWSTNPLGSIVSTLGGKDVYVIDLATSVTFTGLGKSNAVAHIDSFISFNDRPPVTATEGPANGMISTQIEKCRGGQSLETVNDGASYFTQSNLTVAQSSALHPRRTLQRQLAIVLLKIWLQVIWS